MWIYFTLVVTIFATRSISLDLQPHIDTSSNEISNCPEATSDCVLYYLCQNGSINTNGEGLVSVRANDRPCPDIMHVCCKKSDQTSEPITTTPPSVPLPKGCGYRRPNGVGSNITRATEGESQFGEFPWMVAIFRDIGTSIFSASFSCGGALIHPQAVVTAAHCVSNENNSFIIRAGEWNSNTRNEPYPHQDMKVTATTIHPQYYAGALYNDIAFLYLQSPVKLAENIEVVCLPPQNITVDAGKCYSTGWGKDKFGKEGTYQVILKKIDLPQVPRDICQEKLRQTRLGKYFELHSSFMCAGGKKGKDSCKGDGGSPLVCPIEGQENRYYHAGIVSWGIGCGEEDIPGVYASVALFRDWIDAQMALHGLDTTSYKY